MDRQVMELSAQKFCDHIKQRWEGKKVILFCDNLDAHVAPETKKIYGDNNVFLCSFPPSVTESLRPIDAGYGRSIRCAVGRLLDRWLMDDENLASWEDEKGIVNCRFLKSAFPVVAI